MDKGVAIVIVAVLGALAIWAFSHYGGIAIEMEIEALAAIEDPVERIDAIVDYAVDHPDLNMELSTAEADMIAEAAFELGYSRAPDYLDTVLTRRMPDAVRLGLTTNLHDLLMIRLHYGPDDASVEQGDDIARRLLESDEVSGNALVFCAGMRDGAILALTQEWPARVPDPWLSLALVEKGLATGDEIDHWHQGALGGAYHAVVTVAGLRRGEDVELAMIDSLLAIAPDTKHEYFLHQQRFDRTIGLDESTAVESAREMANLMDEHGEVYSLNSVGYELATLDVAPGLAVALCERALELAETSRDSSFILDSVGWAHHRAGNQAVAARAIEKSLAISRVSPVYGHEKVTHLLAVYAAADNAEAAIELLATMVARSADDTTEAREELLVWLDRSGRDRATLNDLVMAHRYLGVVDAPEFSLVDEEGERLALEDCRGKVVFLNFWGPGCAPCTVELPHIQELNERFADRGVIFVSVASSGPSGRATEILAEAGVTYRTFYDRTIFDNYRVAGIPTTVLIDHVGRAMYRHVGFREGDETLMAEELEKLLAWIEDA